MGRNASGEAEGGEESGGLPLTPLGNSKDGKVVGEKSGDGEGEDGGERKASAVRATRIRNAREGGEQIEGRRDEDGGGGCFRQR